MARRAQVSIDNNFKGGLLTEATGLNFPENACTETYNCIHDEKGRSKRRLGFDYENGYTTQTVDRTDSVVSGFTWNNVAGDGSVSLRVVQIGSTLYFYDIAESGALSDKLLATTIDLTTYKAGVNVDPSVNECKFTSGSGYLIVVHPELEPFYVSYDPATEVATATAIDIQIRDFEGLDDGYGLEERKTESNGTISAAHKYNLFNQGWYYNSNAAYTAWDTAFTTMPSNADVWWLFKNANDEFDTTTVANVFTGNAKAPRGHYILSLHDQDRTTASGVSGITSVTTSTKRVSAVAFMGGRVFYSGLNYTGFSSKIYFSQLVEQPDQFAYCYQANDPTSEELSDLLPTDGGVISIYGLESVVALFPLVNALLVFATNGIWAVTGSEGVGFSPEDYTVTKISSLNAINSQSLVDVDGFPYWWNLNGIYRLTPGQQTGGFLVESISDFTIRNFYHDIPITSRGTARGAFNHVDRQLYWIYSSTEQTGPEDSSEYDMVLVYNLLTQSFYPWTISSNVKVHDVFVIKGEGGTQSLENVTLSDGTTQIQSDLYGDIVTTFSLTRFTIAPKFKFTCSAGAADVAAFTFAETHNANYLDWETYDAVGQDYDSYFIIGYKLHSETQRYFQSNYVFVFLEQESSSSAFVRGLWDFTNSSDSNRWSSPQQCYNSTLTNRAVNHRRLKIRGKGRALQLKFYSETGHPFTIIGWSIWETQNTGV